MGCAAVALIVPVGLDQKNAGGNSFKYSLNNEDQTQDRHWNPWNRGGL